MKIHMVKKGDTLYLLSKKYNVSLEKIIAANPQIADPDKLDVGMKVKIPAEPVTPNLDGVLHSHKVQQGDTLWKLSQAWGVPLKSMLEANPQLKNPNALLVGETVYIPSVQGQGGAAPGNNASNSAADEKLSPEGKEYTGVKENTEVIENPVMPAPAPAPVTEPQAEAPIVSSPPEVNQELPNVMPNLEVVPQLPVMPEVKPSKQPEIKKEVLHQAEIKPLPEYTMPKLSPEANVMPVLPNAAWPVEQAVKSPCGCGKKLLHAPVEYPYAQVPVPAQEVYNVEPNAAHSATGSNENLGFPGIHQVNPYATEGQISNYSWPDHSHYPVMPNEITGVNSFPQSPASHVNNPFTPYSLGVQENQPPMISPYSILPYPPCGCGGHVHAQHYTFPVHQYQSPSWNMYDPYGVNPTGMAPAMTSAHPAEYAYQNPYPVQNMVPPAPLGAFGEMYPSGSKGKKGDYDVNLSHSDVEKEELLIKEDESKQEPATKSKTAKRRAGKSNAKRPSKASVSSKAQTERKSAMAKRNASSKNRAPWIRK